MIKCKNLVFAYKENQAFPFQLTYKLFDNFIQSLVFFNAIASVSSTELDFNLILCNSICDLCNRKCYNVLIFHP